MTSTLRDARAPAVGSIGPFDVAVNLALSRSPASQMRVGRALQRLRLSLFWRGPEALSR